MDYKILIIDDEETLRKLLLRVISLEGYDISEAASGKSALRLLDKETFHVVISDVKLPDISGIELIKSIKRISPETEVICLTAFGDIHDGVQAMKNGAFDYLVKGDDNDRILPLLSKASEKAALQFKIKMLEAKVRQQFGFERVIGKSSLILQAAELARKVSKADTNVLLTGETGVGKEVFAQAIHAESNRSNQAFVAVNCSALGREILESELFGHKAGAFTGATKDKKGLFEEAHRGTIFLDEIGEMSIELQAKILRVLETGAFIKVGDTKEQKVDVRVIAATNRDLEKESESGSFRLDLFYRLSVFTIRIPSLDERKEDIPMLSNYFTEFFAAKTNRKTPEIASEFIEKLGAHHWRGNVRELRNVIERAVILCDGDRLTPDLLPFGFDNITFYSANPEALTLAAAEKAQILRVLKYTKGNKTKTAKLLDIGLTTLYQKLKDYQIDY